MSDLLTTEQAIETAILATGSDAYRDFGCPEAFARRERAIKNVALAARVEEAANAASDAICPMAEAWGIPCTNLDYLGGEACKPHKRQYAAEADLRRAMSDAN